MKSCTVILKPTHRCNLNCVYCYDRFERSKDSSTMDKDDLVICLNKFTAYFDYCNFIWHGGEPTILGLDYITYVMEKVHRPGVHWCMQTNGTLLNEDWFKLFKKYDIQFGISWDGINTFSTRGVKIDLDWLQYMKQKYELPFGFLMTVTPYNANDVIASTLAAGHYSCGIEFNILFGEGINDEGYSTIATELLQWLDFCCKDELMHLTRPFDTIVRGMLGGAPTLCEHIYCPGRWFGLSPNGDVTPCGKPGGDNIIFGNLLKEEVSDLLKSSALQILKNTKDNILNRCRYCDYLLVCQNGCCYKNIDVNNKNNDGFDEDYCKYMQTLLAGTKKVLLKNCENGTLVNTEIITLLQSASSGDLAKGKNYKCHTT